MGWLLCVGSLIRPESFEKEKLISGLELVDKDVLVFHAGMKKKGDDIVTSGGRVMMLSALGEDLKQALYAANSMAKKIDFEKKYFRADIGFEFV